LVFEPGDQRLKVEPEELGEILARPIEQLAARVKQDAVVDQLLDEGCGILGFTTQTGVVPDNDETHLTAVHPVEHLLEAGTVLGRGAGQTEVVVDHDDARVRPPPLPGKLRELELGRG
jgi:hypothetical protein